jgi:vancomycin resistance protein YoaR
MITYTWGNPKIAEDDFGMVVELNISMKGVDENNTTSVSTANIGIGEDHTKLASEWTDTDTDIQKAFVASQLESAIEKNIDLINNPPSTV